MGVFTRLFKVGESEAHSLLDKFENPIKMSEQGIRDLKKDLQESMKSLAEVKAITMRLRRDADNNKKLAADYERKAMLLLQKMQSGGMDSTDAERLASEALNKKEESSQKALEAATQWENQDKMANQLQANVSKLKSTVTSYENDLITLKARAKTASATKKLNAQMSNIDSNSTIAMLEKMKLKVEEDECLASAYGDIANADKSIDDEINLALSGTAESKKTYDNLAELKTKMGITG
ncbi:MAG: PspA/IM30 family protein [Candidatus Anammoxibacter sp.]